MLRQITMSPPAELIDRLQSFSERHNVAMVRVVEVALRRFFEAEERSRGGPAKRARPLRKEAP